MNEQHISIPTSQGGKAKILLTNENSTNTTVQDWPAGQTLNETVTGGAVIDVQNPGFLYVQLMRGVSTSETTRVYVTAVKPIHDADGAVLGYGAGDGITDITGTVSPTLQGDTNVTPNGTNDAFCDEFTVNSNTGLVTVAQGITDKSAAHARIDLHGHEKVALQVIKGNAVYWFGN